MRNILIVDDDPSIAATLEAILRSLALVTTVGTLEEARAALKAREFSLVILDQNLPDGQGTDLLVELRANSRTNLPVLMLTSVSETKEKVIAFSLGAEDYIVKPFEPLELRARVESKLQRYSMNQDLVRKGSLILSAEFQKVLINDVSIDLTSTEFKLLFFLAKREDQPASRAQIIDAIWGSAVHVTDRTIDSHVSNLRKKISAAEFEIRAVPNVGYCFQRKSPVKKAS